MCGMMLTTEFLVCVDRFLVAVDTIQFRAGSSFEEKAWDFLRKALAGHQFIIDEHTSTNKTYLMLYGALATSQSYTISEQNIPIGFVNIGERTLRTAPYYSCFDSDNKTIGLLGYPVHTFIEADSVSEDKLKDFVGNLGIYFNCVPYKTRDHYTSLMPRKSMEDHHNERVLKEKQDAALLK